MSRIGEEIKQRQAHEEHLAELLEQNGLGVEDISNNPGIEGIYNVIDADGQYLYTLTVSRTPGC